MNTLKRTSDSGDPCGMPIELIGSRAPGLDVASPQPFSRNAPASHRVSARLVPYSILHEQVHQQF